jgi:2-polyprenyl-3-methyl-5-hydroxy-6-metoxy-1,4-benzoquinol methylase
MQRDPKVSERLLMYPASEYPGVGRDDPIRQYARPIFGRLYRRRVEMCLNELTGGGHVLEVGFGSGVAFRNLARKYRRISGLDLGVDLEVVSGFWEAKGVEVDLRSGSVLDMPFRDRSFDAVLLISILEHLRPGELSRAFAEVKRVLRPGGQVVFGVPIDRWTTRLGFLALGYDIRKHHFSTERQVRSAAEDALIPVRFQRLTLPLGISIAVYQVGSLLGP